MAHSDIGHIDLSEGAILRSEQDTYSIIRELGEGGFASAYQADSTKGKVALKIVKLWKIMPNDRKEYETRLKQEFDIARSIQSENVVKNYDFSYHSGNPYIAMELCDGGSLREKFDNSSIDLGEHFAKGILSGLNDLHSEGVIHRDIKPENILLSNDEIIKLVDFGISGSIKKRHTKPNILGHVKEVFATITYSPPEQTNPYKAFNSLGPTNDIYAFGVTMYEYFTKGKLPFGDFDSFKNDFASYDKRKKKNDWDRNTLELSIDDRKWHSIIEKCLQPKPENRYQSCTEIMGELGINKSSSEQVSLNYPTHNGNWVLRVVQGDEPGREYNLSNFQKNLGKAILTLGWFNSNEPFNNDIGIVENFTNYISRKHATLRFNQNTSSWEILDGQYADYNEPHSKWKTSTNGILINGLRMNHKPMILRFGDIITIGDTTLKVIPG
jgi:serine/threonine protein kinase